MRARNSIVVAILLGFGAVASAGPVTWNFSGIVFPDGTTVTGSFVFNADLSLPNSFVSLNMTTSGGTSVPATSNWFFDKAFANATQNGSGTAGFLAVDVNGGNLTGAHLISLFGTSGPLLTNAGGTIPLNFKRSGTCANAACDSVNFGVNHSESFEAGGAFTTVAAVPEPSTLVLTGSILLVAIGIRRRARRA